jgi:hypothetical protein
MSYTAIIIEPRRHAALQFVLDNFLTNLSDEWNIVVCHGTENIQYLTDIVNTLHMYKNRITLVNLHVSNLTLADYNLLLTSNAFYDYIPTEMFLIFQTDTMIFPRYKHLINNFLSYDYVGAPWKFPLGVDRKIVGNNTGRIGNGGLSLRRKSKMLQILENFPYKGAPEDVYFGTVTDTLRMPSIEEAKSFSIEMMFHPATFGCHKPWDRGYNSELFQRYPELISLYILNKDAPNQQT